jgi:O-antigen/teichoic acid export membrane protein
MSIRKGIQDIFLWRGLNLLSVFILNILLARLLQAEGAGNIFFIINNLSLLILILSFSLESGLQYYAATGRIEKTGAGFFALAWCIAMTLIAIGIFSLYDIASSTAFNLKLAAIFYVAGNLLISFYSALYFARKNFFLPNVLLLTINILFIALFIPPLNEVITQEKLVFAYFAAFLVQGVLLTGFYFLSGTRDASWFPPAAGIKLVVKYSAAAFLGNIIFFLVYRIDYWFVERWCSPAELGNYIQVSKIVQWFVIIPSMIGTVLFPHTAIGKDTMIIDKVVMLARLSIGLFFLVCLCLVVAGYWIFPFVFGETYSLMYPVFLLYIPGILALTGVYPVSAYHSGMNRLGINIKGCLWALIIIAAGNWLFTPGYGIYGAAIISSLGYITYFAFSLYHFNRSNKIRVSQFFKFVPGDLAVLKAVFYKHK